MFISWLFGGFINCINVPFCHWAISDYFFDLHRTKTPLKTRDLFRKINSSALSLSKWGVFKEASNGSKIICS